MVMNNSNKILIIVSLLFLSLIIFYMVKNHKNNRSTNEVQEIIKKLDDEFFKGACPKNITVKYAKLDNSGAWLNTGKNIITLSSNYLTNKTRYQRPICEYKNKEELMAHEICHLCLYSLTYTNSMREEFRFLDEGFAEIMGRTIAEPGDLDDYKKDSFFKAKDQMDKGGLSFKDLQKWNTFFGDFSNSNEKNWNAYLVGSNFIFFVLDKYSIEKLYELFVSISKTGDFCKSVFDVFKKNEVEIEKEWKDYVVLQNQKYVNEIIFNIFTDKLNESVIKVEELQGNPGYESFNVETKNNKYKIQWVGIAFKKELKDAIFWDQTDSVSKIYLIDEKNHYYVIKAKSSL